MTLRRLLRNLPSTNGGCGYCREQGCKASLCPYLIASPPDDWTPDRSKHLWCYSASKRSRERRAQDASLNERTLPKSNLANTEEPAKDFYFSAFQGLAIPIHDYDIAESETPEESFVPDEEFFGYEPNFSGLAVGDSVIPEKPEERRLSNTETSEPNRQDQCYTVKNVASQNRSDSSLEIQCRPYLRFVFRG